MDHDRYERGLRKIRQMSPLVARLLTEETSKLAPDLVEWTIEFGYGAVMSQTVFPAKQAELINVAILATLGHAEAQLRIHMVDALAAGATQEELLQVIHQLAAYAGFPTAYNALTVFESVVPRGDAPKP